MFILVSHGTCDCIYKDSETEEVLRLWAITGGVLALSFYDHSFSERLNYSEKFDTDVHPNWTVWEGPRIEDIFGGESRVREYIDKNLPLKRLRAGRLNQIRELMPHGSIRSSRFHDLDERVYFRCVLDLRMNNSGFCGVSVVSSIYSGFTDKIEKFANAKWKGIAKFFESFPNQMTFEEMTEEQFQSILDILKTI